jgi:hypothetical protein
MNDDDLIQMKVLQGNEEARLEKLGTKCVVKDCANHTHQGRFVGLLCAPCHSFVSGGDGGGGYSQVARNTQREWVGLTDEEVFAIAKELGLKCSLGGNPNIDIDYARAIEQLLKRKNT